jgi:hypothetical protein
MITDAPRVHIFLRPELSNPLRLVGKSGQRVSPIRFRKPSALVRPARSFRAAA